MAPLLQIFLLSLMLPLCYCSDPVPYCRKSYNNSDIETNINRVISDLVTEASVGGYAVSSFGNGNDTIYGLAQCRGDVSSDNCSSCLADVAKQLPVVCPKQADARLWYDYCFMRYNTVNFVGKFDTDVVTYQTQFDNVTDPDAFDKAVSELVNKTMSDAVSAGNSSYLGREKANFTQDITIYALAQCTRDLQPLICDECLSSTLRFFTSYFKGRPTGRVLYSSCMVQYEIYQFYFSLDGNSTSGGA